jgi:hypothetical protein
MRSCINAGVDLCMHVTELYKDDVPVALLPCEPIIARDMLHKESDGAALDEFNPESIQTGKSGLGRGDQSDLPPAVHVGEKPAIQDRDFDDAGDSSPERRLLRIDADVLRENLGGDLYLVFPFI